MRLSAKAFVAAVAALAVSHAATVADEAGTVSETTWLLVWVAGGVGVAALADETFARYAPEEGVRAVAADRFDEFRERADARRRQTQERAAAFVEHVRERTDGWDEQVRERVEHASAAAAERFDGAGGDLRSRLREAGERLDRRERPPTGVDSDRGGGES